MHRAAGTSYLGGDRQGCLKGTRKAVLWEIENWLMDEQGKRIFWLNGLAGTGKSTIAQTVAETAFADGKLGASFFCSRDFQDRSNLRMIFPTLAFQLAYQYPGFREELVQVLRTRPDVGRESLLSQMEKLVVGPLNASRIPTLIIIDALDECKADQPASVILSLLSRYVDQIPNVKFFVTGRSETRIRSGFRLKSLRPVTDVLKLHELKPEAAYSDIRLFFRVQLSNLAGNRSDIYLTEDWPTSFDIEILCKKAAGLFLYASTMVKFIDFYHHNPIIGLSSLIYLLQDTAEGGSGVDLLYTQILQRAFHDVHTDEHQRYLHFRAVVGTILLIFNPLSIRGLSELLGRDTHYIRSTIRSLHSLLLVPDSTEDPICPFHKSFPDFLVDPSRCTDNRFFVEPAVHHAEILLACFRFMGERLKKNICNLDDHTTLGGVRDISALQKAHIGEALEYACCFWTKHLLGIPGGSSHAEEVQRAIDQFFTTHFLHWIEVLALTRNLDVGVYAMNDIEQWYALVSAVETVP